MDADNILNAVAFFVLVDVLVLAVVTPHFLRLHRARKLAWTRGED